MAYDPYLEAIAFLMRRSALERHAIARILDVEGKALPILHWLVTHPDCDLATAAMVFWRVRSLAPSYRSVPTDAIARRALLEVITAKAGAGQYRAPGIAWDGREAWTREPLIGVAPHVDVPATETIPPALFGPFGSDHPEPATHAFLDEPYDQDSIFDSLWRIHYDAAAAADWLIDKPAHVWMKAIDDLSGHHPDDVLEWMVLQPELPRAVAGQIFWVWGHDPVTVAELEGSSTHSDELVAIILERWRSGNLAPCDLDFSRYAHSESYRELAQEVLGHGHLEMFADLLSPRPGRMPAATNSDDDFAYWLLQVELAPRPRSVAISTWKADTAAELAAAKSAAAAAAEAAAAPPTLLERLFYGGKFTGANSQIDRCWKQFNLVMIAGGMLLIALIRGGAPKTAFWVLLALIAILSIYQSSANMGSWRRIVGWWVGAFALAIGLAFLFRWIDKGFI